MKSNVCCQCGYYIRATDYGGQCEERNCFVYGGKMSCDKFYSGFTQCGSPISVEDEFLLSLTLEEIEDMGWF